MVSETTALTPNDRARVAAAVRAAEARTAAEIVVVIETETCEETDATLALVAAGLIAIGAAAPLAHSGLSTLAIAGIQAGLFLILAGLAASSRVRRALRLDRLAAPAAAHRAALNAFDELGVAGTKARVGVLIHVAVADRRAEVIADVGVHEAVDPATWREEVELIVGAAREGRLIEGVIAAVDRCGEALAAALPPEPGRRDELPDELVIR
ncbi:TPM domain-containing protein [Methylopila musalis]|uniref:TPM domain-containing protein n=1 Tax=Methylopila musalis TaxID=1134781 RepID=A0ABW3Z8Z0_9HYPH